MTQLANTLKKTVLAALFIVTMVRCSDDKELLAPTISAAPQGNAATTAVTNAEVQNFTVSGLYTEVVTEVTCSTCTFVVAAGTTQVDGQALDIKPGSVICLQTGVQYPSIEFVNMIGTANSPITIGYCNN
jgi:hypothetical protein